jgi:hypothetical protein
MKKISILAVIVISVSAFYACKKKNNDDGPANPPVATKTNQQILSANIWTIQSVKSGGSDIWGTFLVSACYKDNHYKFRSDDSLILFDNANKCASTDPDSITSYYKYFDNTKKIYLDVSLAAGFAIKDTTNVLELTESILRIDAEYSGIPAEITFIKKP